MKGPTVLCNLVLVIFTGLVVATDGAPAAPAYIVFTLLLVLIPVFSLSAILRRGLEMQTMAVARAAVVGNVVLLGFIFWALVDQYPHPQEPGFVPYVVLALATPVLSALVLLRRPSPGGRRGSGATLPAAR